MEEIKIMKLMKIHNMANKLIMNKKWRKREMRKKIVTLMMTLPKLQQVLN